jgi:hypothetical protein
MSFYPFIPPYPGTALTNYGESWNPLAGNPTTSPYTNYLVGENGVTNGLIQDIFTNWQTNNGAPQLFPGDLQWSSSLYPGGPGNTTLGGIDTSNPGYSFRDLYPTLNAGGEGANGGGVVGSLYTGGVYTGLSNLGLGGGGDAAGYGGGGAVGGGDPFGGAGAGAGGGDTSGGGNGTQFAGSNLHPKKHLNFFA